VNELESRSLVLRVSLAVACCLSCAGRLLSADACVPKYSLSSEGMSGQAARQIVQDECLLDGRPGMNLASFVSTWMEEEAQKLLIDNCEKNIADQEEYPVSTGDKERDGALESSTQEQSANSDRLSQSLGLLQVRSVCSVVFDCGV
jgi:hypothetical protein